MKHLIIISILITLCFGVNVIRAPKVEAEEIKACSELVSMPDRPTHASLDQHLISLIPDLRSTAGSPGKNIIFAEDGQNVAVIYSRFSGDPVNILQIIVSYSTDRGNTWIHYGPFSNPARRAYSGLDATDDFHITGRIYFTWSWAYQYGGVYDTCRIFHIEELSYPNGLFTPTSQLPNSETEGISLPCIGVRDSVVIITGGGKIWRSTDYGASWDTGRVFTGEYPHFRFGFHGYMFFLWLSGNNSWPYYCESFDYGETWTDPQLLWGNNPPYPNMSNVRGSWYGFDCEVVQDTPVTTLKLSADNYDYGEIWAYRPDSGVAGNWRFKGKKLVGGDSTSPQTYARFPTIAADDSGNAFIGYQAYFPIPGDTVFDIGLFARPAIEDTWYDWGRITFNGNVIEENHLEFAHNAPIIVNGDSIIIGMVYHNAGDYPITGNLYFDYFILPNPPIPSPSSTEEIGSINQKEYGVTVAPNPFRNSVKFMAHYSISVIRIYDVTGKLVRELTANNKQPKTELIWDGRNAEGTLAKPGIYFYNLSSADFQQQGKLILSR